MTRPTLLTAPGCRFGRLTVTKIVSQQQVECLCDCGNSKTLWRSNLRSGTVTSCGCEPGSHKWEMAKCALAEAWK